MSNLDSNKIVNQNRAITAQQDAYQNDMLAELLNLQQSGVIAYDAHSHALKYMNQKAMEYFEVTEDDYQGRTMDFLLGRAKVRNKYNIQQNLAELRQTGGTAALECSVTHSNGRKLYLSINSKNVQLAAGQQIIVDVLNDITDRVLLHEKLSAKYANKQAELEAKQLELEEKHYQLMTAYKDLQEYNSIIRALRSIFDTCYYFSVKDDTFLEITGNRQLRPLFKNIHQIVPAIMAYLEADVDKQYWPDLRLFSDADILAETLKGKPFLTIEFESRLRGWCRGYLIPAQYNAENKLTHCLYACEIIDEQKRIHKHLKHIAETDGLTGINNRSAGESKINSFIAQRQPGAFGILDCDYFKQINDTYGHQVGDNVLIILANALAETFGDNNVVMRMGGDEFAFFLPGCITTDRLQTLVNRFFNTLSIIPMPEQLHQRISISVGATFYKGIGNTGFDELYECADRSLYESKKYSGNKLTCH